LIVWAQRLGALVGRGAIARYAPLLQVFHGLMFLIGVMFWIDSMRGSTAFSPAVWGDFAYSFPAWMWAGILMTCTGAILVGLIEPMHRRLVLLGSSVLIVNHVAVAYSAFATNGDPTVGLYASILFLPLNALLLVSVVSEWKA
jgi:hypothetical protein